MRRYALVGLVSPLDTMTNGSFPSQTGMKLRVLDAHGEVVTALAWLPDGSGFISGGLDRKIILWVRIVSSPAEWDRIQVLADCRSQDIDGTQRDSWGRTPIRVTDLAITPDFTKLVAIGMYDSPTPTPVMGNGQPASDSSSGGTATPPAGPAAPPSHKTAENRIIVYDLLTKQLETCVPRSLYHYCGHSG